MSSTEPAARRFEFELTNGPRDRRARALLSSWPVVADRERPSDVRRFLEASLLVATDVPFIGAGVDEHVAPRLWAVAGLNVESGFSRTDPYLRIGSELAA
jgi:hypothetical protein